MKRTVLIAIILVSVLLPLSASTNLLNLGYNVHKDFETEWSKRGYGVVWTHNGSGSVGFHAQVSPWLATSWKSSGTSYGMFENDNLGLGLNFILGVGSDINFGQLGLVVGGGVFGAAYATFYTDINEMYYHGSLGVGGDTNLYFQFSEDSPFLINAGLTAAWRPVKYYDYSDWEGDFVFEEDEFNFLLTIGIGWRS